MAANNDFAEIVLSGVAQYRFFFIRIGERGGFRPQLLSEPQSA